MGNRLYNILWLAFLPVLGSVRAEKVAWLEPQADVRLVMKTESGQGRYLLIPVPLELQQLTAVTACDDKGTKLSVRPLLCQGKMPALALDWERQKIFPGAEFHIYFHESAPAAVTVAPDGQQAVVRLERSTVRLTTRPHDAAEMVRLFGSDLVQSRMFLHTQVNALGIPHERYNKQERTPEKRQVATLFHWSASFLLEEEAELVFGAPADGAAWELLVDAASVAGWQQPGGSRRFAAGLHAIQLLAVAYAEESLPQVSVHRNGEAVALALLPPLEHQPVSARLERRDSDESWSWGCGKRQRWYFPQTGVTLQRCVDNGKLQRDVVLPDLFPPGFSALTAPVTAHQEEFSDVSAWAFTIAPDWRVWQSAPVVFCRMQWHSLHQLLPARQNLSGHLTVHCSAPFPAELLPEIQLQVTQFDADGEVLTDVRLTRTDDGYDLDVPLAPGVARLTMTPLLAETMLTPPEEVWVLTPDSGLSELRRSGRWLRQAESLVLLRCQPLQRLALPSRPQHDPPILVVPDDRRGRGQQEQRGFATQLAEASGMQIKLLPFAGYAGQGGEEVLLLAALTTAKVLPADYILLDPEVERLRRGMSLDALCQEVLFAAQVAAQRGVTPILLLPPPPQIARPAVLRLKELAFALGMPVCDLYSAELRDPLDMVSWFRDTAGEYLRPSAVGQSWLAQSLAQALRRGLPERGVDK